MRRIGESTRRRAIEFESVNRQLLIDPHDDGVDARRRRVAEQVLPAGLEATALGVEVDRDRDRRDARLRQGLVPFVSSLIRNSQLALAVTRPVDVENVGVVKDEAAESKKCRTRSEGGSLGAPDEAPPRQS